MTSAAEARQTRRIYVGGLFPEIHPDDLRSKFARFGSVEDIQIKVRRDEQGEPVKTFAHLNINGTKKDLEKCFSMFSRAKWKGFTLVLQTAKENFLTRLEKERGEAAHPLDKYKNLCLHDPLAKAPGVQDFVMRGAVPGTPIPGQKNWVVGKYGRVLPILQLKKPNQSKMVRVDPSKLCHNLKKLKDEDVAEEGRGSLTWSIDSQDSDITRKRKGEFQVEHKRSKKAGRQMVVDFLAQQQHRYDQVMTEANDFEILLQDGTVKNNTVASGQQSGGSRGRGSLGRIMAPEEGSSNEESADTDEIIASTKLKAAIKKKTNIVRQPSKRFQKHNHSSDSESETGDVKSASFVHVAEKKGAKPRSHGKQVTYRTPIELSIKSSASDSSSGEFSSGTSDSGVSASEDKTSGDNQRVMKKKTASQRKGGDRPTDCSNRESSHDDSESDSSSDEDSSMELEGGQDRNFGSSSHEDVRDKKDSDRNQPRWRSGIPEFRGRAVLDQRDDHRQGRDNNRIKQYTVSMDTEDSDSTGSADTDEILSSFRKSSKSAVPSADPCKMTSAASPAAISCFRAGVDEFSCGFSVHAGRIVYPKPGFNSGGGSDSSQEYLSSKKQKMSTKEECDVSGEVVRSSKQKKNMVPGVAKLVAEFDKQVRKTEGCQCVTDAQKSSDKSRTEVNNTGRDLLNLMDKHIDDNRRRLETIRERKREIQNRKAAIQDALALVDSGSRLNKKIVFDSDDDEDEETPAVAAVATSEAAVNTRNTKMSSFSDEEEDEKDVDKSKPMSLFDSSGSSSEDEDDKMFRVRPQYEGEKGRKLMELQARLGSDQRFRLDERFVESDEDQENVVGEAGVGDTDAESERARALRILEEVVGRHPMARLQRQETQRKKFKDMSTLHFDPACEQHRQLEVQISPKEKIKKKKVAKTKEDEASEVAIPEVSKERFFEVSSAIQNVFNKTHDGKERASDFSLMAAFGGQSQTDAQCESKDSSTHEFTVSSGAMNPWQSRFSVDVTDDSTDTEEEQQRSVQSVHTDNYGVAPVTKWTFFFSEDDRRLQEGIEFFKRPQDFDAVQEKWREQRPKLMESYREKWRKAVKNKRKLQKPSVWHSGGHQNASRRVRVNRR
ncbi:nucleolar protein 8-like isoform X2 [Haliotis asinina]|uniref:nucleolar protein 8-like isoform X2 n=1 Tax=Haliotis asinina TaxID=109174 RepID=UPI003531C225